MKRSLLILAACVGAAIGWRLRDRTEIQVSICTTGGPMTDADRLFVERAVAHIKQQQRNRPLQWDRTR